MGKFRGFQTIAICRGGLKNSRSTSQQQVRLRRSSWIWERA